MIAAPGLLTMVAAFVLLLGPLVVIHELGHYLVGRLFGVKAEVFSVGFGRELAGWTDRRSTRWKLSALPLGGYVRFAGDEDATSRPGDTSGLSPADRSQTLAGKPVWQRALVVFAGPLTNALLAIAIFAGLALVYGVMAPVVAMLVNGSPAAQAGVRVGDRIVAIDGDNIDSFAEIEQHVAPYPGRTVALAIRRGDVTLVIPVRVAPVTERDSFGNANANVIGRIGIAGRAPMRVAVSPTEAVHFGFAQAVGLTRIIAGGIAQIFTGERSVRELSGPVGTAKISGEVLSLGWAQFIAFAGFYSLNLAFINLLPIPGLDGGHLAFYAAEAVRRKPLEPRSQDWAFRTGVAFVLALMLFVTINDLVKLLPGSDR